MPSSRDHRSRSRDRLPDTNDNNKTNDGDGDNHLEHIIRKVLALALNKFDNNANSPKEDSRAPTTERERGDRGGGDNDLAKLVLSHVLQFGVRRYLKSREKKKVKAVKGKTNVKMPSRAPRAPRAPIGGPLPLDGGPPGTPTDRGLPGPPGPPDRGIGSASQYYYPPSPQRYGPPPRYDPGEDRRQERRERYERRLERERLEQLERMRRGERDARQDRFDERPYRRRSEDFAPNPPLPRRVPREPLPKSTSFQEPQSTEPQESQAQHDYARERRARRRRQEAAAAATPQTPQTPLPAHLQWQRDDAKYARRQLPPPQDRPIRPREALDDTAPRLQPPPPRLFSWESVPVYPPPPTRRDSRPTDLPTPPISPKKAPTFTDKQIGIPPLPYDDLRRALDDLILQLRRTDSVVYRTVYHHHCHHHHGHHHHHRYDDDPERRRLLRHTSALRRSMAETKAEARGMKDALGGEFRIQTETGEFRIQTERERERVRRSEERPKKRVTVQLPGEESVDRR